MRRQEYRQAEFALKTADRLAHLVDAFGIQSVARFVEDEQFRTRQERLRQSQPRAHAV